MGDENEDDKLQLKRISTVLLAILKGATLIAALFSIISQAADILAICEINRRTGWLNFWAIAQAVAVRLYGMTFAAFIITTELSELSFMERCLAKWKKSTFTRRWALRGLAYTFVGLFALESAKGALVVLGDDDEAEKGSFLYDDSRRMAATRSAGSALAVCGVVYTVVSLARRGGKAQENDNDGAALPSGKDTEAHDKKEEEPDKKEEEPIRNDSGGEKAPVKADEEAPGN